MKYKFVVVTENCILQHVGTEKQSCVDGTCFLWQKSCLNYSDVLEKEKEKVKGLNREKLNCNANQYLDKLAMNNIDVDMAAQLDCKLQCTHSTHIPKHCELYRVWSECMCMWLKVLNSQRLMNSDRLRYLRNHKLTNKVRLTNTQWHISVQPQWINQTKSKTLSFVIIQLTHGPWFQSAALLKKMEQRLKGFLKD